MSAHTADSYHLPTLSYVDAKWEEPNLRSSAEAPAVKGGIAAWLSRKIAAFINARRNAEAMAELNTMTDRELADIGMNRADLDRVFDSATNGDLRARGFVN